MRGSAVAVHHLAGHRRGRHVGVSHWNFGDDAHTTWYEKGVEQTNFPYTVGHVVWNGVEYAQVGGVLYRIDGGAWRALEKPTTIDGNAMSRTSRSSARHATGLTRPGTLPGA